MATAIRVAVIGSGPAGYTAAVYLGRARLQPVLFTGYEQGGQLMYTSDIENFPGFPDAIRGQVLMGDMRKQAERFETQMVLAEVQKVTPQENGRLLLTTTRGEYEAEAVLVATGAKARMQGLSEEATWLGRGLSVCAVCDAAFFPDKNVYVVGGGDSAMEDAIALTKFAKSVTIVHRRDAFRASKIMQERVLKHPKITVLWNHSVSKLLGDDARLTQIELEDLTSHEKRVVPADGLFYAIGHVPSTQFLADTVARTAEGYIITRFGLDAQSVQLAGAHLDEQGRVQYPTMTSVEGIFAAGDCVDFSYRQAVTAAGYGTMAALDIERWLERGASA